MGNKSAHSVNVDKHSFSSQVYSSKLVSNFYDLWTSEQLCDVVLRAGSYSVKAHRCVLAAASPYFQAMFTSGLVEQTQQVVVLPTLQPHVLAALLAFIYTGMRWLSCRSSEREAHAPLVFRHVRLAVVSKGGFTAAIAQCPFSSLTTAATAAQSEQLGEQTSMRPRLSARKKIYVMGGAKRELLGSYRRSEIALEAGVYLDTFTKEWHSIPPMTIGRVMPGLAVLHGKIYAVGGEVESRILANGELYDPLEDAWADISPMVVPRCEFGLCAHEGLLYAFGGWVGEGVGGSIERYDDVSNTWTEVGTLREPRFSMGAVEHEGLIYLVGGCTESQRQRSDLLSYNPVTTSWTVHASMPTPRSRLAVAVLDGFMYAVGGTNKDFEVLSTVERYSFDEDRWKSMAALKVGRASPAIAAANNSLYVMGGDMPSDHSDFFRTQVTIQSVEVYDPYTDTWTDHPPLPESRSEAVAAVF
ncbi:Kelch repeat type 1 [Trinorchestia longiramus]|nr:Kelch repeat type 1 [Trinorchestia longiramus]